MSDIKPGDEYQHRKWPKGTPNAVVGKVEEGVVYWSAWGGAQVGTMLARYLSAEFGWRKVRERR